MITQFQLQSLFTQTKASTIATYVPILDGLFDEYGITTTNRIAMFLAQVGVESEDLSVTEENLNYSAEALLATFPTHFNGLSDAIQYARQPEKIANRVYANRMGNGDEASGDGWLYRGRGLIQLTGHNNYQSYANILKISIQDLVTYAETSQGAAEISCVYWKENNLNQNADLQDVLGATKKINGGINGLQNRQSLFNAALKIFT